MEDGVRGDEIHEGEKKSQNWRCYSRIAGRCNTRDWAQGWDAARTERKIDEKSGIYIR
jgi:hypothetical protein